MQFQTKYFKHIYYTEPKKLCSEPWIRFEDACYVHSTARDSVPRHGDTINNMCKRKFGQLSYPVTIHNARENKFVLKLFMSKSVASTSTAWIGLSSDKMKRWVWSDNKTVTYNNWIFKPGRPAYGLCTVITQTGAWFTKLCKDSSAKTHYICKYSLSGKINININ